MTAQENVEILRESIELHNDPETRDQYLDDYSEDLVLHGANAESYEELAAFYETVWEAIPDLKVTLESVIAEDDEVAVRYSWEGTHAVTGEEVSLESGLTWYRFEDGKIVERWVASGTGGAIRDVIEP
ncbi:ester cyclase [Natrinema longum]|uniref:Ester cyclase n=1 Tax=Natrinema longum TaxID=370324 RepID=A0A8A2U6Y0_9EURY|nr:nuclear transport factor 2 family protein [Natrinema longum]MBZ6495007.1 ester cyclase [Natrinema longum]QSW83698.1 ester cyclase [Natrinema longum]